jgi:hypothetical protein
MEKIVYDIFEACVLVSETTEHDVFFRYSPHVGGVTVQIHYGGWESEVPEDENFTFFEGQINQDYEELLDLILGLLYE